jgi:hypothetical protein
MGPAAPFHIVDRNSAETSERRVMPKFDRNTNPWPDGAFVRLRSILASTGEAHDH